MQKISTNFWKNKRVLVTGHTGFKGSWLCIYLLELGAEVYGYALEPSNKNDNYVLCGLSDKIVGIRGDIRDLAHLESVFMEHQPEIVFHMAAQPLVRESYESPKYTYECNVMGSLNVLEAVRKTTSVKTVVMITTDKCYENRETAYAYKETDPFGGYDPYSSSKACAEILIASYRNSFMNPLEYPKHGKGIASVRAGNVIGGGDWAKDRIMPDCIRALEEKKDILIRNPKAVRPWQHVVDALNGYLILAERLYESPVEYAQGWNFGPEQNGMLNVGELTSYVIQFYGEGNIIYGQASNTVHEAYLLNLDISKAKERLGWRPLLSAKEAVELTVDWYKRYQYEDAYSICREHIQKYWLYGDRDYIFKNP